MTSKTACPYVFFLSLLAFNMLNKTGIWFCPYDFSEVLMISAHGSLRFWPFLRPQATKKGACHSFVCLLTRKALVNRCDNKPELVHALKRELSACLFSR